MLSPRKVKHRKQFKGRNRGVAQRGSEISFGDYALKAIGSGKMSSQQIEAARIAINRKVRRGGTLWIRVFPDKPVTKKPAETRMGKPGKVLYELKGIPEDLAVEALRLASYKLPFPTAIVTKGESI